MNTLGHPMFYDLNVGIFDELPGVHSFDGGVAQELLWALENRLEALLDDKFWNVAILIRAEVREAQVGSASARTLLSKYGWTLPSEERQARTLEDNLNALLGTGLK